MKGAPKHDRVLAIFIFSDNLELVTSLNFEPIMSAVIGKIHYSNFCMRFSMSGTPYESAAAPTPHSATDPVEFNIICHSKPNLLSQTDSSTALLPYLTHQ